MIIDRCNFSLNAHENEHDILDTSNASLVCYVNRLFIHWSHAPQTQNTTMM